jgi:hypothetical protein
MLLCRFGCDELYERGYLVISEEGKVIINKKCEGNSASSYLDSVVNRNCTNWNNSTERFFAWHRKWHS